MKSVVALYLVLFFLVDELSASQVDELFYSVNELTSWQVDELLEPGFEVLRYRLHSYTPSLLTPKDNSFTPSLLTPTSYLQTPYPCLVTVIDSIMRV